MVDVEKSLDINNNKNPFIAIQYHLYEHPLYKYSKKGDINVIIIGFGNYGQKFLDACLQNGQIINRQLYVTVISDDENNKDTYLSERIELDNFFDIDGSITDDRDSYGHIAFETVKLNTDDQSSIAEVLNNIICKPCTGKAPHYIFVALGDDDLNIVAANACETIIEEDCVVSYICENVNIAIEDSHIHRDIERMDFNTHLIPLYVNRSIEDSPLYEDIERMAFNTHLTWKKDKDLDIDYNDVKREFEDRYNHDSCVSNVLSLKYKLYSIGIDLDTTNFKEAAHSFIEMMGGNQDLQNKLVWIEHRRWVTEKLCQGWRRKKTEECVDGITNDRKNRKHVCIVRSHPDQKLAAEYSSDMSYWDNASIEELKQLDELDRMSVELHRMFVIKADEDKKRENSLDCDIIKAIRTQIDGNKKAVTAFNEWNACLKSIYYSDRKKVHLYEGLTNSLLKATEVLHDDIKENIKKLVYDFKKRFYHIYASVEYCDWKKKDVEFIKNIPFILTYTENTCLVIPFEILTIRNISDLFGNVSAATVVNPREIIYLYYVEEKQNLDDLYYSIPYIIEYIHSKKLRATVEFIIVFSEDARSIMTGFVQDKIKQLGKGKIYNVVLLSLVGSETVSNSFKSFLEQRSYDNQFFAVEKNRTRLSYLLDGGGFYNSSFKSYKFESNNMEFYSNDCDMLKYIDKEPYYITVTDMLALRQSSIESSNNPEFFEDYESIWEKYEEATNEWKMLCDILSKYAKKNDKKVKFIKEYKSNSYEKYSYDTIPIEYKEGAEKIIRFLKEHEIVGKESCINVHNEVIIVGHPEYKDGYYKIFRCYRHRLKIPDTITLYYDNDVHVVFENLDVKDANIDRKEIKIEIIKKLIGYFEDKRYVTNFSIASDGKISLTYANRQIKELLTTAGKILEIYTYHKIKELKEFDDVVCSSEINWEKTHVKSEFDCILTKGFRTFFVECKARPTIDQNFYFKLSSLTQQFGINATAVLIADTKWWYDYSIINAMQRKRGSMMNVVTIWKQDEIKHIGDTLLKVIKGEYRSEENKENV